MCNSITFQSQSTDDNMPLFAHLFGESIGHVQAIFVCGACANDSHIVLTVEQILISKHVDERRCISA